MLLDLKYAVIFSVLCLLDGKMIKSEEEADGQVLGDGWLEESKQG